MTNVSERCFVRCEKGLFEPELLRHLRSRFCEFEKYEGDDPHITEREKNAIHRGESSDKMRMQACWYEVWKASLGCLSSLLQAVGDFGYVTYPVQLRHVSANSHKVPWHQDIGYMRRIKNGHSQVITCFIPLEEKPSEHTTIQFLKQNIDHEMSHLPSGDFGAGVELESNLNDSGFHFELDLGDALIFGDHALHRTYTPECKTINRRSLEFRLVKKEHRIQGKDYFDLQNQKFILHT